MMEKFLEDFNKFIKSKNERIPTGISFLDKILEQGIPVGKIDIICGESNINVLYKEYIEYLSSKNKNLNVNLEETI